MAEHVDQSTAPVDEKLRRFLRELGDTKSRPPYVYFHYDGFPRANLAADALAFLSDIEAGRLIVSTAGVMASGEVIGYWHPRTRAFITPEQFASIKADVPRIAPEWLPIPHPAGVQAPPAPLTNEQIVARCKAAGINWLPPASLEDGDFPGMFDMATMDEMRKLLDTPGVAPAEAPRKGEEGR